MAACVAAALSSSAASSARRRAAASRRTARRRALSSAASPPATPSRSSPARGRRCAAPADLTALACSASPTSSGHARPLTRLLLRAVRRRRSAARCASTPTTRRGRGLGSLALSRHQFRERSPSAGARSATRPYTARDLRRRRRRLVELGRYRRRSAPSHDGRSQAEPLLVRPRLVRARAARRVAGATQAMRLALDAAAGEREPMAWTPSSSASSTGLRATRRAARSTARARGLPRLRLRARRARAGGGGARASPRARSRSSSRRWTRCRCRSSSRSSAISTRAGNRRPRGAVRAVGAIERLLAANGVRTDLETAQFQVDHGIRLGEASRSRGRPRGAPVDRRRRHARAGRSPATAAAPRRSRWSQRALRLGTQDALKLPPRR